LLVGFVEISHRVASGKSRQVLIATYADEHFSGASQSAIAIADDLIGFDHSSQYECLFRRQRLSTVGSAGALPAV
jgi:hypothetical protein